jgi:predicted permease
VPLLAALTLGVAMALVTVEYTALHQLLFRRLPFDPTGRLVSVRWSNPAPRSASARPTLVELRALQRAQTSFSWVSAYQSAHVGHSVRLPGGRWIQREGLVVLPGLLEGIGVRPQLGRAFLDEDFLPGAAPVVMLSHRLWEELGGDPKLLGSTLYFDRRDHLIVAVAAPGPTLEGETFWTPGAEGGNPLEVLAALRPDAESTLGQANQELARVTAELGLTRERLAQLGHLEVVPARAGLVEPRVLQFYGMMFGAVLLVLLGACANVSNLLMARAAGRLHELAVRACLGASRGRLLRELLLESLGIGGAAALLGLGLALLLSAQARAQAQVVPLPAWVDQNLDGSIAAVVAVMAIAAAAASALLPALRASRLDLRAILEDDPRTSSGLRATRTTSLLQGTQLAICGPARLAPGPAGDPRGRSADLVRRIDPRAYLGTALVFPRDEFRGEEQVRAVFAGLERGLRELPPGLRGAVSSRAGLGPGREIWVQAGAAEDRQRAFHAHVGLGYFAALEVPLLEGRAFDEGDGADAPRVAIVDTSFVDRFWPGQSAVGRTITAQLGEQETALRVVGVVPSLHMGGAASDRPDAPGFFTPLGQLERRTAVFPFVTGPAGAADKALAAVVRAADPERPPRRLRTFQAELDAQQSGLRVFLQLFGALGLAALALSAGGLYGIFALGVRQRVREIGTRLALGATPPRIVALFLVRSARLLLAGVVIGGALGAVLLTSVEKKLGPLGGAGPAFLLTALGLALVCFTATLVPALRGARLSPMTALREG